MSDLPAGPGLTASALDDHTFRAAARISGASHDAEEAFTCFVIKLLFCQKLTLNDRPHKNA